MRFESPFTTTRLSINRTSKKSPISSVQTSTYFDQELNERIERIEGVLIYLTGAEVDDSPCRFCQADHGPFPLCVIPVANGIPQVCANFRWSMRQCTIATHNRQDWSDIYRERVIDTEAWNNFEQAMDALGAALAIRGGGDAPSPAVVLASQTLPPTVHDARLRVIVRARAIRHYFQIQQLMLYTLLSHA
ncbi:Protein of unknown function DUF3716 [Penicillium brevicompactum]|uniref:Uncharacterized protein n=1 Tax=Penicillium brevicompactum TaxID=5074 RepID=A0A9W9R9Y7_PENBR|nr:Protein of unknown function DUF3716 [Penicillium brevicompactum]